MNKFLHCYRVHCARQTQVVCVCAHLPNKQEKNKAEQKFDRLTFENRHTHLLPPGLQKRRQKKSRYVNKLTQGINLAILTIRRNLPVFVGLCPLPVNSAWTASEQSTWLNCGWTLAAVKPAGINCATCALWRKILIKSKCSRQNFQQRRNLWVIQQVVKKEKQSNSDAHSQKVGRASSYGNQRVTWQHFLLSSLILI